MLNSSPSRDEWFASPMGRYVVEHELALHDVAVADVFGFHALQLGFPEADLLRANRIPHKFRIWQGAGADLRASFDALPLATQSFDLAILPHVLEFAEFPHQILREVDRVMM